jgi:hypothetical protein
MNVGLRPRLKARPSLYDLIRDRNIDSLSVRLRPSSTDHLLSPQDLPPLPPSPTSTPFASPTSEEPLYTEFSLPTIKMPPKKQVAKDEDGEDQYGISPISAELLGPPLIEALQVRFILCLGMGAR